MINVKCSLLSVEYKSTITLIDSIMASYFVILCIISIFLNFGKSVDHDNLGIDDTFYYFGYGSNLLESRLHLSCPSAVREGFGKLNNYELKFEGHSRVWHGAGANIEPNPNSHVWGAIWKINRKEMSNLDKQEAYYSRMVVPIETSNGAIKKCITYQGLEKYKNVANPLPSKIYLKALILGAKESNLPQYYQKYLQTVPHNGYYYY